MAKRGKTLVRRESRDPKRLLDRIVSRPDAGPLVRRMRPETLHRVIDACGLEACGELLSLATAEQLAAVFDVDLWRASRPGQDEALDAARFGEWLEVLVEHDAAMAARRLADMDGDLAVAGLAQHVRVFDAAAASMVLDGEVTPTVSALARDHSCAIGGYEVLARRSDAWDAVASVLVTLEMVDRDAFLRLMRGCRRLSASGREFDGLDALLDDRDQVMFDLARAREERRGESGYVTPAAARAFLQASRGASGHAGPPPALVVAGGPRLALLTRQLAIVAERDDRAQTARQAELAFLANTILAGCSRPLTSHQASQAAAAICNLGLENLPPVSEDFLVEHDLSGVFKVGWAVLYERVALRAAEALIDVLADVDSRDGATQLDLHRLRVELTRSWRAGTPWAARGALGILASLDLVAWNALVGLVDELPVLPEAIGAQARGAHRFDAAAFEFISDNGQIAAVHAFLQALPSMFGR